MCGEKRQKNLPARTPKGSPPRVRGKEYGSAVDGVIGRITPACAGKSRYPLARRDCTWDHPRVCGEKCSYGHSWQAVKGSPPRVRGKVSSATSSTVTARITPACAGESPCPSSELVPIPDHPRVCGEKSFAVREGGRPDGSPPRVRGKGFRQGCQRNTGRITPACAGKRTHHEISKFPA